MKPFAWGAAQIKTFVTVAEERSFSQAARRLHKDRKTISEKIENLEIDLGYSLFTRSSRQLLLTENGSRLLKRAQILLAYNESFARYAETLMCGEAGQLTLCFDESIDRSFLLHLEDKLRLEKIKLNLLCTSRSYGEMLLKQGKADYGLFLSRGKLINSELRWRIMGSVEMKIFAHKDFFSSCLGVLSIQELSSKNQLVLLTELTEELKIKMIISDSYQLVNDIFLFRTLLERQVGWSFAPTHYDFSDNPNITSLNTEIGLDGFNFSNVLLWGKDLPPYFDYLVELLDH
ncbi:LysR family transcriptional regulator [Shewanella psychropiezotolerans]|uniref:LysR family transcriptional regulator n=1 Tax=Shewanella psychropiezotolerans TaxID=2593655 RepID=A0ABX5X3H2_9GAMM|nr:MULTISPECIES: LysR family transcriptional regulator [Shewanella]MPY26668.1 LysR family transcriptional regulator [Shewanella sp. YLB-07]QDO85898.1 LysR family transcriptional regulator [Shewanella psychropiezotolerans]